MPPVKSGQFAKDLACCRKAALALFQRMEDDPRFLTAFPPELDIIVWAPAASNGSEISKRSRIFFEKAAQANLHLALLDLPVDLIRTYWKNVTFDQENVTCLRSCLMKPEHFEWIDKIWTILDNVAGAIA